MRSEVKAILAKLIAVRIKVQSYLDNAAAAENPNEDRIEELDNEIEALGEAIDALDNLD